MLEYLERNVEHLMIVDTEKACEELGSAKVLNVLMLGAALKTDTLGLSKEAVEQVMLQRLPEKFHELNLRALNYFRA